MSLELFRSDPRRRSVAPAALLVLATLTSNAPAAVPRTVSFSGTLLNAAGQPKPDGSYNLTFRLYDAATGGNLLWTEADKPVQVTGGKGLFTTLLGTPTSFGALSFDRPYFLEIQVAGEAAPMSPRLALSSAPYSLNPGGGSLALPYNGTAIANGSDATFKITNSGNGYNIWGASPDSIGVYGESTSWVGVWGRSNTSAGVVGDSQSWAGVWGQSVTSSGVTGISRDWSGAWGESTNSTGVVGKSANWVGVYGESPKERGVWGHSDTSTGVLGDSSTGWGVHGKSGSNTGLRGESFSGFGVHGSSGDNSGVQGDSLSSFGAHGHSSSNIGVLGTSGTFIGMKGHSDNISGVGVYGDTSYGNFGALAATLKDNFGATVRTGVYAGGGPIGPTAVYGLYAQGGSNAAVFVGSVYVIGGLGASDKHFRIDHPLDPANKTLTHACAEGPEGLNIYNGNVTTDANGEALVTLPDYFEALNRDYRYQLTCIGQFAQAIVSEKVRNNRFTIRTDKPNVEVSWMVTGVRNDAYARANPVKVEEMKPEIERGRYLNPEAFGQPSEKGIGRLTPVTATSQAP